MAKTRTSRFVVPGILLACFAASVALLSTLQNSESASAHLTTVPENPRRNLPVVLDGTVYDMTQVGNRVYVVGNFQEIQLPDGTVITQPHFFAYDLDDGTHLADIAPTVENGSIRAIEATPDGSHLLIGGSFTRVDGRWRNRLAKLDLDGEVDRQFVADVDSEIETLDVSEQHVFIGGNFENVGGLERLKLAAVDVTSGQVDDAFDFPITQPAGWTGVGAVKRLDLTPDLNTLIVAYNALQIGDTEQVGLALIDVEGAPALRDWRTDVYDRGREEGCIGGLVWMRDMDIAPNGEYFVVTTAGHDAPPACDTAVAFPINATGTVEPLWVTRNFDSTFSVGISDAAVYIGGHFCFTEGPGAPDFGFETMPLRSKPQPCQTGEEGANTDVEPWVARRQIAALDPSTGWALDWNPGSNAQVAVYALEVIDRGLLIGQDNDRINQVNTGRHAFLDFGPLDDATAPEVKITFPALNKDVVDPTLTFEGIATDAHRVDAVTIRLHNRDADLYLQSDGSFGANAATLPAETTASDRQVTWNLDVADLPSGRYTLSVKATDRTGNTTEAWKNRVFTVPFADASCSVSLTPNGNPSLEWTPVAGVSSWQIRRNNAWKATVSNVFSWVDEGSEPGAYTYSLRFRADGETIDLTCGAGPIVVEEPEPVEPTTQCWVSTRGDEVTLTWTEVNKAKNQSLRRDDRWVASLEDVTTTTDVVPDGTYTYAIRYTFDGARFDIDCGTVTVADDTPPVALECTATVNGTDVALSWTAVEGEDAYTLRRDGRWVAALGSTTAHVDSDVAPGAHTYAIRFKQDGINTDIDCGSVTVGG